MTRILRSLAGGRLKSQDIENHEYPPYYFGKDGKVRPEFADLRLTYPGSDRKAAELDELDDWEKRKLFALGIPRGNIHYGFTMMSTLFLREHNRLAGRIAKEHHGDPDWDDERIFQTARDTLIVLLLNIVIEDYINHITPFYLRYLLFSAVAGLLEALCAAGPVALVLNDLHWADTRRWRCCSTSPARRLTCRW